VAEGLLFVFAVGFGGDFVVVDFDFSNILFHHFRRETLNLHFLPFDDFCFHFQNWNSKLSSQRQQVHLFQFEIIQKFVERENQSHLVDLSILAIAKDI
jgi:hypothetical protein